MAPALAAVRKKRRAPADADPQAEVRLHAVEPGAAAGTPLFLRGQIDCCEVCEAVAEKMAEAAAEEAAQEKKEEKKEGRKEGKKKEEEKEKEKKEPEEAEEPSPEEEEEEKEEPEEGAESEEEAEAGPAAGAEADLVPLEEEALPEIEEEEEEEKDQTAPGGIQTMDDLQSAVKQKTAAIPQATVKSGGPSAAAVDEAAKKAQDRLKLVAGRVPVEAKAAEPGPKPLPPLPEPTPENPVPHAGRLIEEASGKPLEKVVPPPLVKSPRGNIPKIGDRPVSAEDFRRLRSIQHEEPFPPDTEQEKTRQELYKRRNEMLAPTDPKEQPGEPLPIPLTTPAEPLPLPPDLALEPAKVFARLLAEPDKAADDLLRDARKGLYPDGVVERVLPDLGSELKADLTATLDARLRELADKGGVTVADLNQEVSNRQAVLRESALVSQADVQQCSMDGALLVSQAGQEAKDAAASQAATLESTSQGAMDAVSQGIDTQPIETRRDTLISTLSRRVALADLAYNDAGTERRSDLDSSERGYVAAYQAVAQRDELQLLEKRPERADDVRIRELTIESQTWRDKQIEDVRKTFEGLRTGAKTAVDTLRGDLGKAGAQAREEVRDWAAAQSGQVRTDWDRLFDQTRDWATQLTESARALKEKTDRETAATVNENLVLIDRLKKAADEGIQEEELLRHNQLSAEQRAIVSAFFESRKSGKAFDPIEAVATGLRAKVLGEMGGELNSKLETQLFEKATWKQLEEIGNAGGGGVDIAKKAHDIHEGVHGGLFGSNEPEKVMGALTGGLNKPQMEALKKKYLEYGEGSLEADLTDQLSKGEWKRAQALMANDKGTAVSAELYTAMKEGFLGTGLGTDEKTIMKSLRGLSAKERDDVIAAYKRDFGRDLREDLKGELDDWATETKHDVERAEALLDLNVAKADAIAVDQALYTSSGSDRREGVAAVYDQLRSEVDEQAKREGWTPAQREAEITRRSRLIEKEYDQKYAETKVLVPGPDGHLQEVRHGSLRESFNKKVYSQEEKNLLHAYADNKRDAIDAAKIRIERTSTYTSDSTVLDTLGAQQDRALEDARAEIGPQKRQARLRELAIAEEEAKKAGKPWTPEERFRRQKLMEQAVEADIVAAAQVKSKQYMDKLQETYQSTYKESVSTVVKEGLSTGNNQKEAETLLARGYLTPYEQFKYAVEGVGTREEMGKKALHGKTKAQIAEIKAQWELEHPGEPFTEALDDFSGDDRTEVEISAMGTPETIDDVLAIEQKKVAVQRPTNWFASQLAGVELKDMEDRLKDLEETHKKIKGAGSDMSVEDQKRLLGHYDFQAQATSAAVESHRETVAAVTESIANVASITVALVIGIGGAIFTGGASAALALAIISSIAATATSIGTRALLLGSSYGSEELWTDIGMGAIDVVVSALTAGMGSRLLGLRQVAAGAVKKQGQSAIRQAITKQLARFGNVGRVTRGVKPIAFLEKMAAKEAAWYSRFAAEAISESIENTVQSLPSALVSTAMDERTWEKGNPLSNLVSGVGGQLGQGLIMGLGVGHATKLASGALDLIKGPRLGVETHAAPPPEMTPTERAAHLKEFKEMYPGKTEADFDATIQRERAAATKAAEEQASYRDKVREELKGSPDAGAAAAEVPITVLDPVEFHRLQGLKGGGDAMIVVRDGQVHLVVKEGADPAVVKEHAAKVKELAEPGTGGRTKNPADSLPKDVRAKVPIEVNPDLGPRTVRVHYEGGVRIEVGPNATAADIQLHVKTTRTQLRYQGALKRVFELLDRFDAWMGKHGDPPRGTRAWEARHEIQKLPDIIQERQAALARPDLDPAERAYLERDVLGLLLQLAEHQRAFKEMDLSPGKGFIAAESEPKPRVDRKKIDEYPREKITDSPLARNNPDDTVYQVGHEWPEGGDRYRLVERVDKNGVVREVYEENFSVKNTWVKRGSEINLQGRIGETASELYGTATKGPHDFSAHGQDASGHGFDQVMVKFDEGKVVVENGVPRLTDESYVPKLVISEDKFMQAVTFDSITAINPNLIDNLVDKLFNRLVDLQQGLVSPRAFLPPEQGGLGLRSQFEADMMLKALWARNFEFEVRLLPGSSLGDPAQATTATGSSRPRTPKELQAMIMPRLRDAIRAHLDLSVPVRRVEIPQPYLDAAAATLNKQNRIGETPRIHDLAESRNRVPSNQELREAWVAVTAERHGITSYIVEPGPAPGQFIDAKGKPYSVVAPPKTSLSGVTNMRDLGVSVLRQLGQTVRDPATGASHHMTVLLDVSHMTDAQVQDLKKSLFRLALQTNSLSSLERIVAVSEVGRTAGPFMKADEFSSLP